MARADRPKHEPKKPKKTALKQPMTLTSTMPVPEVEVIKKKRKEREE